MRQLLLTLLVFLHLGAIADTWQGTLNLGAYSLTLTLHIDTDADGNKTFSLDSPDQGAFNIPAQGTYDGKQLNATVASLGATLRGQHSTDDVIDAVFTQNGMSFPITLNRKTEQASVPTVDTDALDYIEQPRTYNFGDVTLAGTLTLPRNASRRVPAVVMITGSGTQDRNETIGRHQPFAVIAHHLAAHGIASLRCDDRGAGQSSPLTGSETTLDFANDARLLLQALAEEPKLDPRRLGYLGHSEGGLIALLNNNTDPKPAFIIAIAAPTVNGVELIVRQNATLARLADKPLSTEQEDELRSIFVKIASDQPTDALLNDIKAALAASTLPVNDINRQLDALTSPWYRQFLRIDPTQALSELSCPLLALYGERDAQVDPAQNATVLRILTPKATVSILPGHNHLMQPCNTTQQGLNYALIDEPFSEQALNAITSFLKKLYP